MQKPSVGFGALLGTITSIPVIALSYLGEQVAGLPFIPFDLFDWLARALPGDLVTFGIDTIVSLVSIVGIGSTSDTAKAVEMAMAVGMVVVAGAVLGALLVLIQRRASGSGSRAGAGLGLLGFGLLLVVEFGLDNSVGLLALLWLAFLTVGWGAILGEALAAAATPETPDATREQRRALLVRLGGSSLAVALGAGGIGRFLASGRGEATAQSGAGQSLAESTVTPPDPVQTPTPPPPDRLNPAPGTRPELTSNEDFYRIDINTRPPVIDGETWELQVDGLFANARNLTMSDLMQYQTVTQAITLSCISNRIGGDLISTGYWTGVRLRDVVEDLGLQPEAGALYLEAEDGFFEVVVMDDIMDERTMLVYGMNGETLPTEHGYPLRIYIPNRYGMKQPKWIVRMEAIEEWEPGYWVKRNWSREARPHIVSVIDTIATDEAQNGMVPVGGIAWAGDRGIEKVEVQVDDGDWAEAELRQPPLSSLTWVQWRYDWPAADGAHTLAVRATDGNGDLQIEEQTGVRPDGATGYHSMNANVT